MKYSAHKSIPEIAARLTIGTVFVDSGWGKLHDLPKVVGYFESLGIPLANLQAPLVSGLELVAGLFILTGFFTRLSSLPLIGIMLVAIRTAHWDEVTDFSTLLSLSEFLYIVILTWLASYGAQFLSIDKLLARKSCQPKKSC